jgi:tetratricopeptide (TPR) repeat protein
MMIHRTAVLISLLSAAASAGYAEVTLENGYSQMYNLQFEDAHGTFKEWERLHPSDPMGPVSDAAAFLFEELDRLHVLQSEFFVHDQHWITDQKLEPDPVLKERFEKALDASRALSERAPDDVNSQFASVLRNGLHSDYLALIARRYVASLQEMKAGRMMAEKLLAKDPELYDAWIAVGVENYMLSMKGAPVRLLLRLTGAQTDRAIGVEKLKLAAEKGHYLAPFARLMLAVVALRDNDPNRARELLSGLAQQYPHNPLYRQELARLNPAIAVNTAAQ